MPFCGYSEQLRASGLLLAIVRLFALASKASRQGEKSIKGTQDRKRSLPRVAASSYLNTAPLIWSFIHGARREEIDLVTDAAPARCADLLAAGKVDAALMPVIEYQRIPQLAAVPGVCVGSRDSVKSVVLVTRGMGLSSVKSVALDVESRTSAALVTVIFREFLSLAPRLTAASPDLDAMLEVHDAALLIGDPAMVFPREGLRVYDMAALWRQYTGLGFVFAMWMARSQSEKIDSLRRVDFAAARSEGLSHVEDIAALYEAKLGLARTELRRYLGQNICFTMDEEMQTGLELFFQLAYKHGVIAAKRPLELLK